MNNEGFIFNFLVYGVYGLIKPRRQIPRYLPLGGQVDANRHQDTNRVFDTVHNLQIFASNACKTGRLSYIAREGCNTQGNL